MRTPRIRTTMRQYFSKFSALSAVSTIALGTMAVMVSGCQAKATAIMLRVDTDIPQGPMAGLTAVRVVVRGNGSSTPTYSQTFELLGTRERPFLPATLPIIPLNNDATRILTVEVTAIQSNTELFTNQSVVGFEREKTTRLDVFLADRCRNPANQVCAPGTTCGQRGCEPTMRGPLPEFDPTQSTDASTDRPSPVADQPNVIPDVPTGPDAEFDVPDPVDVPNPIVDVPSGQDASFDVPNMLVDRPNPVDIPTPIDTGVVTDVPNNNGTVTCAAANIPLAQTRAMIDLAGNNMWTLNTSTGTLTGGVSSLNNCVAAPPATMSNCPGVAVIDQGAAPQLLVIDVESFSVPAGTTVRVTGARGVVFRSPNAISIAGVIDGSGTNGANGMVNAGGAGGAGGPGGGTGGTFMAGVGCDGRNGNASGTGGGQTGSCGSAGARGGNSVSASGGGGGGGGSCGGGGASGGSFARPGGRGEVGGTAQPGLDGANMGGAGGSGCNSMAAPGNPMPFVFDDLLIPLRGGYGGGAGGFGALHGFGGNGSGASAGFGGATGFAGGGGGGGGAGGAIGVCSGVAVRILANGELRANGSFGGVGGFAGGAENGSNASVVGGGAAGGGGGAGGSGAGGGGGGGSGGAVFVQSPVVDFQGRFSMRGGLAGSASAVPTGGGFGGVGRGGGGQGGRGGQGGVGGAGGTGGDGAARVISPMFNNAGVVVGLIRHDPM